MCWLALKVRSDRSGDVLLGLDYSRPGSSLVGASANIDALSWVSLVHEVERLVVSRVRATLRVFFAELVRQVLDTAVLDAHLC